MCNRTGTGLDWQGLRMWVLCAHETTSPAAGLLSRACCCAVCQPRKWRQLRHREGQSADHTSHLPQSVQLSQIRSNQIISDENISKYSNYNHSFHTTAQLQAQWKGESNVTEATSGGSPMNVRECVPGRRDPTSRDQRKGSKGWPDSLNRAVLPRPGGALPGRRAGSRRPPPPSWPPRLPLRHSCSASSSRPRGARSARRMRRQSRDPPVPLYPWRSPSV